MTKRCKSRLPVMGEAFDSHQNNVAENLSAYVGELRYYASRRFAKLIAEGESFDFEAFQDLGQAVTEWQDDCDAALTEWAKESTRCEYWSFGPFADSGSIGFSIDVDFAVADADLQINDLSKLPKGFSGLAVMVNDHGNVTAWQVSNGRKQLAFTIV